MSLAFELRSRGSVDGQKRCIALPVYLCTENTLLLPITIVCFSYMISDKHYQQRFEQRIPFVFANRLVSYCVRLSEMTVQMA